MSGRVITAHGLSDEFCMVAGTGQGCNCSPNRANIDLAPLQWTLERLIPGYPLPTIGGVSWRRHALCTGARAQGAAIKLATCEGRQLFFVSFVFLPSPCLTDVLTVRGVHTLFQDL